MSNSKVIQNNKSESVVLNYVPQEFPVIVSDETNDFVSEQTRKNSNFELSEVISEQVGITELKKKQMASKLEDKILEDLKGIEEKAYKEAYDLGLIEGEKKAYTESLELIEKRLVVLDEFLENTQVLYRKLFEKNEALLIKVLYSFASKIAMKEISECPEEIVNIVNQTVGVIQGDIKAHVFISESDKSFLDEIKKNIKTEYEFLNDIEVTTSEEVKQGGCVIETNFGEIDASVEERIDKVWQSINEKLPKDEQDKVTDE